MLSGVLDKMVFIQNGMDEIRRNITMNIDVDNNGGSFVDLDNSFTSNTHLEGYKKEKPVIETALLADLIEAVTLQERPSKIIIKMDIEGFECRAILGTNEVSFLRHLIKVFDQKYDIGCSFEDIHTHYFVYRF